jgi:L1 cell adhesion molecule like protein
MLKEEKMKTALGDDYTVIDETIKETLVWIEKEDHTKEEYEEKQKEVEGKLMPIIQKAYQGAQGASSPEASSTNGTSSGTEVD